jgi:N-methylhydantoinase B
VTDYDPISLGIHWDRLISICDEVTSALIRSSFSTNVRESHDLSCLIFDRRARAIAQGTYSIPSFTGTAPATIQAMLQKFPTETLRSGDVIVTNDPWIGTGHLFDINVMRPVFRRGTLAGFTMSITHLPDIGGAGYSATAREIYEEGLRLPICKLVRAGAVDQALLELIAVNVRVPEQTLGDLMANITANEVGARMLVEFMDEYALDAIDDLAEAILQQSERAMRAEIAKLPAGIYRNRIAAEGIGCSLDLACTVEIGNGTALVDFAGTSPAIPEGINVPLCYSRAMAAYAIKCMTTPRLPNNEGSVGPIRVVASPGCVLDARSPFATGGRHIIGHFVVPLIFGALADAIPDRIQADSGMLNLMNFQGIHRDGRGISSIFFASGGFGALADRDGAPTTPSPSNMTGTPVEVWENLTSMLVERKQLLTDSGGPGRHRGGLGQEIALRNTTGHVLAMSCLAGRTEHAPQGFMGGHPGRLREIRINGRPVSPKGKYFLEPGDQVEALEAGGGGFGPPEERPAAALAADVANGFVSPEAARRLYRSIV